MSQELIDEVKALRKEVAAARKEAREARQSEKERARRAKYDRLKAEGRLPLREAVGRGMPTIPTYSEWNGLSKEEDQAEYDYYNKTAGRL